MDPPPPKKNENINLRKSHKFIPRHPKMVNSQNKTRAKSRVFQWDIPPVVKYNLLRDAVSAAFVVVVVVVVVVFFFFWAKKM